jgi:hypothetical protein
MICEKCNKPMASGSTRGLKDGDWIHFCQCYKLDVEIMKNHSLAELQDYIVNGTPLKHKKP